MRLDLKNYKSTNYFLNIDINTCETGYNADDNKKSDSDNVSDFALIMRYKAQYYIPYNSQFTTLLYTSNQLSQLNIDTLMWYYCILLKDKKIKDISYDETKKKQSLDKVEPPTIIQMYRNVEKKSKTIIQF